MNAPNSGLFGAPGFCWPWRSQRPPCRSWRAVLKRIGTRSGTSAARVRAGRGTGREGSPPEAPLAAPDEHQTERPNGWLAEEREFAALQALMRLGHAGDARARVSLARRSTISHMQICEINYQTRSIKNDVTATDRVKDELAHLHSRSGRRSSMTMTQRTAPVGLGCPCPLALLAAATDAARVRRRVGWATDAARVRRILFFTHLARLVELAREAVPAAVLREHRLSSSP